MSAELVALGELLIDFTPCGLSEAGNLRYEINVESDDEIGYLAASLAYMAQELARAKEGKLPIAEALALPARIIPAARRPVKTLLMDLRIHLSFLVEKTLFCSAYKV